MKEEIRVDGNAIKTSASFTAVDIIKRTRGGDFDCASCRCSHGSTFKLAELSRDKLSENLLTTNVSLCSKFNYESCREDDEHRT